MGHVYCLPFPWLQAHLLLLTSSSSQNLHTSEADACPCRPWVLGDQVIFFLLKVGHVCQRGIHPIPCRVNILGFMGHLQSCLVLLVPHPLLLSQFLNSGRQSLSHKRVRSCLWVLRREQYQKPQALSSRLCENQCGEDEG